jgi:hypothetical protein
MWLRSIGPVAVMVLGANQSLFAQSGKECPRQSAGLGNCGMEQLGPRWGVQTVRYC